MAELKPCPFCGGEAVEFECTVGMGKMYFIQCSACYVETVFFQTEEKAIETWNRREEQKEE